MLGWLPTQPGCCLKIKLLDCISENISAIQAGFSVNISESNKLAEGRHLPCFYSNCISRFQYHSLLLLKHVLPVHKRGILTSAFPNTQTVPDQRTNQESHNFFLLLELEFIFTTNLTSTNWDLLHNGLQ